MAVLKIVERDGKRVEVPENIAVQENGKRTEAPNPDYSLPAVGWRARVFVGRDPDTGKRSVRTSTFSTKKAADRWARDIEGRKEAGPVAAPSKDPLTTYLRHWLDNVKAGRVRARTLTSYRDLLESYVFDPPAGAPPIGMVRLDRLGPTPFEELYGYLWKEKGLSPRTLQYLHTVIRQALKHAVQTGKLPKNPTEGVKYPRHPHGGGAPKRKIRAMTRGQTGEFLKAADKDRFSALWRVLLFGGLRPGEAYGLLWDDVDLEGGRLHVQRGLTRRGVPKPCECGHDSTDHDDDGSGACQAEECGCENYSGAGEGFRLSEAKTDRARRVVVLPDVAMSALRAHRVQQAKERLEAEGYHEGEGGGFVFATSSGTPLDESNMYRRFRRLLNGAKLDKLFGGPYDLRHTHATLLLLAGENPKVVSERLGHASVTLTLDTYSHVLPTMQEESARKLDAMFG